MCIPVRIRIELFKYDPRHDEKSWHLPYEGPNRDDVFFVLDTPRERGGDAELLSRNGWEVVEEFCGTVHMLRPEGFVLDQERAPNGRPIYIAEVEAEVPSAEEVEALITSQRAGDEVASELCGFSVDPSGAGVTIGSLGTWMALIDWSSGSVSALVVDRNVVYPEDS